MVPYRGGNNNRPNPSHGHESPTRYLTPEQIEEYKRKGLCWWCDGKWNRNHKCKSLHNIVVVDDSECSSSADSDSLSSSSRSSSSSSSEEEIQVKRRSKKKVEPKGKKERQKEEAPTTEEKSKEVESLHSIQDPHKANAMRVFGRINGQKVLILLDSGATNNFLTEEATERCKVSLKESSPQTIIVGGGYRLKCLQEGKDMSVTVKKKTFKVDCLVIPLEGVDLILGMPWFLTWKDIRWDVKNFTMTFFSEEGGESIMIQGLASSMHPKTALRSIQQEQPACWVLTLDTDVPESEEKRQGRMRHEVLVEWEVPDRGTSWEEFGSIVHCFPSSRARGQAQGGEGESVTDQPLGPDPVGTEQAKPSRWKRKASDLWARSLQLVKVSPNEGKAVPETVAAGGAGGATRSSMVLKLGESQGVLGSNVGLTELERSNQSESSSYVP
ncbi:hypothetical protein EJ110_NYTH35794 [Nymphaea thermarum]|nr:hypothetical protein EJ110_NYTH35794 [Nymphaea thermarum]